MCVVQTRCCDGVYLTVAPTAGLAAAAGSTPSGLVGTSPIVSVAQLVAAATAGPALEELTAFPVLLRF